MSPFKEANSKPNVGWREWIALPGLGIKAIKVKIDTGARSSSLHAFDVKLIRRGGGKYVRFSVHPLQRSTATTVVTEAEVLEFRKVKSSTGHTMLRPVILTDVEMLGMRWPIGDQVARTFARTFYATLLPLGNFDSALLAARQSIRRDDLTWVSPLLVVQA